MLCTCDCLLAFYVWTFCHNDFTSAQCALTGYVFSTKFCPKLLSFSDRALKQKYQNPRCTCSHKNHKENMGNFFFIICFTQFTANCFWKHNTFINLYLLRKIAFTHTFTFLQHYLIKITLLSLLYSSLLYELYFTAY